MAKYVVPISVDVTVEAKDSEHAWEIINDSLVGHLQDTLVDRGYTHEEFTMFVDEPEKEEE